jgi:hypothetical protein
MSRADILVLSVATKNITDDKIEKWRKSLEYYGYPYKLLSRDKEWSGFNMKINDVLEELENIDTDVVVITDCTDLFFTAPSDELLQKFINSQKDVIIGGEMDLFYSKGKYPRNKVKGFLENRTNEKQKFPNGGFLIGKRPALIRLLDKVKDYKDDQAAYIDVIYTNALPDLLIDVDSKSEYVGNLPKYGWFGWNKKAFHMLKYDKDQKRIKNKQTNACPTALHFPGSFYEGSMNRYFKLSNPDIQVSYEPTPKNFTWIYILIFVMITLCLVILR